MMNFFKVSLSFLSLSMRAFIPASINAWHELDEILSDASKFNFFLLPERFSPRKCYKANEGKENRYSSWEKSFHSWLFAQNSLERIIGSRLSLNEYRRLLCRDLISLMNNLYEVVDACVPSYCENSWLSRKVQMPKRMNFSLSGIELLGTDRIYFMS